MKHLLVRIPYAQFYQDPTHADFNHCSYLEELGANWPALGLGHRCSLQSQPPDGLDEQIATDENHRRSWLDAIS